MDIDPSSIVLPPGATNPAPSMDIDPDSVELPEVAKPSIMESLGRGALQGATFGFADEISGALESAFGNKTYKQARDESRDNFKAAADAHPTASMIGNVAGGLASAVGGGELVGAGAKALGLGASAAEGAGLIAGGAEATTPVAEAVAPSLGRMAAKGAATGAGYGALQGLGDSQVNPDDPDHPSEFHQAITDTLKGAGIGALGGAVLGPVAEKAIGGAAERQEANLMNGIAHGEGTKGSATVTAKKLLAGAEDDIQALAKKDPAWAKAAVAPAKEGTDILEKKLNEIGSALDPNYKVVTKFTGGKSAIGLYDYLTDQASQARKDYFPEAKIDAIEKIRDSMMRTVAPDLLEKLQRDVKLGDMGLEIPKSLAAQDVMIPEQEFRKAVTKLQSRATKISNTLTDNESSIMKGELAGILKDHLDAGLDVAAENGGPEVQKAVDNIRALNHDYRAAATTLKAVESRGWKEGTGSTSAGGLVNSLLHKGGAIAAAGSALSGHPLAALGSLAASYAPEQLNKLSIKATSAFADMARKAAAGKLTAQLTKAALQQGVPRELIIQAVKVQQGANGNLLQALTTPQE